MALIGVLLLLILVSALCAALAVSGLTETLAADNQMTAAQARAAAEAGLNHAVTLTLAQLTTSAASTTPSAAIDLLLRGPNGVAGTDDGSLEALGIPRPPARTQLLVGVSYEARVFDDDDAARGLTVPLSAADRVRIKETSLADPLADKNQKIVVRAIGYAQNNATVTLEALIGLTTLPAIVTNQDLLDSGKRRHFWHERGPALERQPHGRKRLGSDCSGRDRHGNGDDSPRRRCGRYQGRRATDEGFAADPRD